jgi:hypothetical protein
VLSPREREYRFRQIIIGVEPIREIMDKFMASTGGLIHLQTLV